MSKQILSNIGMLLILLMALESRVLAARLKSATGEVKKRQRYSQLKPASEAAISPDLPATNVVEEDLVGPESGKKKEIRKKSEEPLTPQDVIREDVPSENHSVTPGNSTPPPAADPGIEPPPFKRQGKRRPLPWEGGVSKSDDGDTSSGGRIAHRGDYEEDDSSIGVSLGIGFGYKAFSSSLGLTFPIYRWFAWSLAGSYMTAKDDDKEETKYGPEGALIVKIPWRIPLTPFAGIGVGYDKWRRAKAEKVFDDSGALYSHYFLGVSIPMAEHIALDISETWKTYLGNPPKKFEDVSQREAYGSSKFNVGLTVVF